MHWKFWEKKSVRQKEAAPLVTIDDPLSDCSGEELSAAALSLPGIFAAYKSVGDSFYGPHPKEAGLAACDRKQAVINELREQYAKYEPFRMRLAIMSWLDSAQGRLEESRADFLSGEHRRQMDRYRAEQDERQRRNEEIRQRVLALTPRQEIPHAHPGQSVERTVEYGREA